MMAITKFLNAQDDQRHRFNWTMVLSIERFNFYLVHFPRGEQRRVKLLREDTESDDMEDVTEHNRPIKEFDLDFWYNAQRDMDD